MTTGSVPVPLCRGLWPRLAASVFALAVCAVVHAADDVAVKVASRVRTNGETSLLFEATGPAGKTVDEVTLALPSKVAAAAKPGQLPAGWSAVRDGSSLKLSGPAAALPLRLRVDAPGVEAPSQVAARVRGGRSTLAESAVAVTKAPAVRVITALDGVLGLPKTLYAGDAVSFEPLDAARTPAGGQWTVAGTLAQEAGGRYRLRIPGTARAGDPIAVSYVDPWGERIVDAPSAARCGGQAPSQSDKPRLEACSPMAFAGQTACVCGWFPTDAAREGLTLNGKPLGAPATGSSGVVFVKIPADTPPGPARIGGLESGGFSSREQASTIVLRVGGEIDRNKLLRGESVPMRLWVEGTPEPLKLRIRNDTPDVIRIDGGDDQLVSTDGKSPNSLTRTVHAVHVGDFHITYSLATESCPCAETVPHTEERPTYTPVTYATYPPELRTREKSPTPGYTPPVYGPTPTPTRGPGDGTRSRTFTPTPPVVVITTSQRTYTPTPPPQLTPTPTPPRPSPTPTPQYQCKTTYSIEGGPGITVDAVSSGPGGGKSSKKNEPIPMFVAASDVDQLLQTCTCTVDGQPGAATHKYVDVPDSLQYRWKTLGGAGSLAGATGPATLYQPPALKVGEQDSATVEVQITDLRGNDKPASVQFTVTVKRVEECKYERAVSSAKKTDPGKKKEITDVVSGPTCSPQDPSWEKTPGPLKGDVPGKKVKVCVGERALLTATGSDTDTLVLPCAGACGSDTTKPELDDPVRYTWEAEKGDFPEYGGHPTSDSDTTSIIYRAPSKPGNDVVKVHIQDSGKEAIDQRIDKTIQVTAYKLDLVVGNAKKDDRAPDCDAYYVCLNDDDDDKKGVDDRDVKAAAEDDLIQITLKMEPEKSGNPTLSAASGGDKIRVWKDAHKSEEIQLPYSPAKLPVDVWVEGYRPSDKARDVELVWKSDDPHCEVHRLFTVERPDIDMDGVVHAARQNPGGFVCVNKDDDDKNGVPDKDDAIAAPGVEDDLVAITIDKLPKEGSVTFSVAQGGDKVRVWEPAAGNANLKGGVVNSKSYQAADLPKKLWVEGIKASGALRDVRLEVKDDDSGCTSVLLVTVVEVDLKASMHDRSGGYVSVPEADEEKRGAFVAVNTDDDNADGTLDVDQRPVPGEKNLLRLDVDIQPKPASGIVTVQATAGADKVRAWLEPTKGTALDLSGGIRVSASALPKTYWIEAAGPSGNLRDVELTGRCDQPKPCDDKVKVTAVQLHLQTDLDMDGTIDRNDWPLERKRGAYVVVNNDDDDLNNRPDYLDDKVDGAGAAGAPAPAGAHAERDLKQFQIAGPLPAALQNEGKVILRRSNAKIAVYSASEKGAPARILWSAPPAGAGPAFAAATEGNGMKTWDLSDAVQRAQFLAVRDHLWVEGVSASAAERDASLTLSYAPRDAGVELALNQIDVTVVFFRKVEATIDPTPPHTARAIGIPGGGGGGPANNTPANHVYSSVDAGIIYTLNVDDAHPDPVFEKPHALVLIRRGDDEVDFAVTAQPVLAMKWKVDRASDDAAALGTGKPAIIRSAAQTMTLGTDERGSFLVSVYYDVNGNGKYDAGEPRSIVPLILVDTTIKDDLSETHDHISVTRAGTAATWSVPPPPPPPPPPFRGENVSSGVYNPALVDPTRGGFDVNNPTNAATYFGATVDFVGGGPAGQRGLDRAFGGWMNNEVAAEDVTGNYQNGHTILSVFATNGNYFPPGGAAAPAIIAPPFLDSGYPDGGLGGGRAMLTQSRMGTTTALALGNRVLVEAVDSPGQGYSGFHYGFPGSRLTGMTFNMDFHAWLVVWTNVTGNRWRTNDPAERTYSSVGDFAWTIRAEWTVDAQGLSTRVRVPQVTKGATATFPVKRAKDMDTEVRYPRATALLGSDARN